MISDNAHDTSHREQTSQDSNYAIVDMDKWKVAESLININETEFFFGHTDSTYNNVT